MNSKGGEGQTPRRGALRGSGVLVDSQISSLGFVTAIRSLIKAAVNHLQQQVAEQRSPRQQQESARAEAAELRGQLRSMHACMHACVAGPGAAALAAALWWWWRWW